MFAYWEKERAQCRQINNVILFITYYDILVAVDIEIMVIV